MANAGKWVAIMPGWYRYDNAAGKTLAYAQRYRSWWNVTVLPMADAAQRVTLSATPRTLREAKQVAETTYRHLTIQAIKRQAEERARVGH